MKVSTQDAIAELKREMQMRTKLYPGWITKGTLKKEVADLQILRLQKAIDTLEGLSGNQSNLFE